MNTCRKKYYNTQQLTQHTTAYTTHNSLKLVELRSSGKRQKKQRWLLPADT